MKKILLLIILITISISSFAQQWEVTHYNADPLTNTPDYTAYSYIDASGNAVSFLDCEGLIRVFSNEGIFNYGTTKYLDNWITGCIIGFYDSNYNLTTKISQCAFHLYNKSGSAAYFLNKNKETCQFLADRLLNVEGYVRIIIPLYKGGNLDMMIPSRIEWNKMQTINNPRDTTTIIINDNR